MTLALLLGLPLSLTIPGVASANPVSFVRNWPGGPYVYSDAGTLVAKIRIRTPSTGSPSASIRTTIYAGRRPGGRHVANNGPLRVNLNDYGGTRAVIQYEVPIPPRGIRSGTHLFCVRVTGTINRRRSSHRACRSIQGPFVALPRGAFERASAVRRALSLPLNLRSRA